MGMCLQWRDQAAWWHLQQQGGTLAPHMEEVAGSILTLGNGREPHQAAVSRSPYTLHHCCAKASQGTLQSSEMGSGCRIIL